MKEKKNVIKTKKKEETEKYIFEKIIDAIVILFIIKFLILLQYGVWFFNSDVGQGKPETPMPRIPRPEIIQQEMSK